MLKWLALLFMTIDHIAYYFYSFLPPDVYIFMRCLGRLAFPIFAYYLVTGFNHTRDPFRYLIRMACWATVTHFGLAAASVFTGRQADIWTITWTNVMVLFTFAITMLIGYDLAMRSYHDMIVSMTPISDTPFKMLETHYDVKVNLGGISLSPRIGIPLGITAILVSFWAVYILKADYEFYGLLTVLFIYIAYQKETGKISLQVLFFLLLVLNTGYVIMAAITGGNVFFSFIQSLSIISIFFFSLAKQNIKKPGILSKYFFYIYYPAHMIILIILSGFWEKIINFVKELV